MPQPQYDYDPWGDDYTDEYDYDPWGEEETQDRYDFDPWAEEDYDYDPWEDLDIEDFPAEEGMMPKEEVPEDEPEEPEYHWAGALKQAGIEGLKALGGGIPAIPGMLIPGEDWFEKLSDENKAYYEKMAEDSEDIQEYRKAVAEGQEPFVTEALGSVGPTFAGLATYLIPYAGPILATGMFLDLNTEEIYNEAKQKGADEESALLVSRVGGAINTALDMTGIGRIAKTFKPAKYLTKFLIDLGLTSAIEGGTEGLQEVIADISSSWSVKPEKESVSQFTEKIWDRRAELAERFKKSAAIGAAIGGVLGGAGGIGSRAMDRGEPTPEPTVPLPPTTPRERQEAIVLDMIDNKVPEKEILSVIDSLDIALEDIEHLKGFAGDKVWDKYRDDRKEEFGLEDTKEVVEPSPAEISAQAFQEQEAAERALRQSTEGEEGLAEQLRLAERTTLPGEPILIDGIPVDPDEAKLIKKGEIPKTFLEKARDRLGGEVGPPEQEVTEKALMGKRTAMDRLSLELSGRKGRFIEGVSAKVEKPTPEVKKVPSEGTKATPEEREPWEMGKEEFVAIGYGGEPTEARQEQRRGFHETLVKDALEDGDLTPAKYKELHEATYGPLKDFALEVIPEVAKPPVKGSLTTEKVGDETDLGDIAGKEGEGVLFHGTSTGAAIQIQKKGLKTKPVGRGIEQVSFSENIEGAESFAQRKSPGREVMLRVKKTADITVDERIEGKEGFQDFKSLKNIPPENIEVRTREGKWVPLQNFDLISGEPTKPTPKEAVPTVGVQEKLRAEKLEQDAKTAAKTKSFRVWVKYSGGIQRKDKTWAGEIRDLTGKKGMGGPSGFPPGMFKESAQGIDEMTDKAIEAGWLPKGATEQDFMDALDQGLREKAVEVGTEKWVDKEVKKHYAELNQQVEDLKNDGYTEKEVDEALRTIKGTVASEVAKEDEFAGLEQDTIQEEADRLDYAPSPEEQQWLRDILAGPKQRFAYKFKGLEDVMTIEAQSIEDARAKIEGEFGVPKFGSADLRIWATEGKPKLTSGETKLSKGQTLQTPSTVTQVQAEVDKALGKKGRRNIGIDVVETGEELDKKLGVLGEGKYQKAQKIERGNKVRIKDTFKFKPRRGMNGTVIRKSGFGDWEIKLENGQSTIANNVDLDIVEPTLLTPITPKENKKRINAFIKVNPDREITQVEEGDTFNRVVWGELPDVIDPNDLDMVSLEGVGNNLRALHVTEDPEFWSKKLQEDYEQEGPGTVIEIEAMEGDILTDDPQYAIPEESGYKADSGVLVTGRKIFRKGKDFIESGEKWPELPEGGIIRYAKDGQTVIGAFHPQTGRITLVANAIGKEDVWPTVLHEVTHKTVSKQGWEGVFGARSGTITRNIEKALAEGGTAWKAAEQKAIDAGTSDANLFEETITYYLADNSNRTQSLWRRIVNAIRAWAVNLGIKREISDKDIVSLAENMVQREARGRVGVTAPVGGLAAEPLYAMGGLKAQTKAPDWRAQLLEAAGEDRAVTALVGEGKPSFQETLEPVTDNDYIANRKESKSIKISAATNIKRLASEAVEITDKFLGSISTRLGQVSPKLKAKLRRLDFDINKRHADDVKQVEPMLRKAKKMTKDDFADWDYARKNSDADKIAELVTKYNMQEEYSAYRKTLNRLKKEGVDVGVEIGTIEEYSPRILKDSRGFLTAIGKDPEWPIYSRRLQERAKELDIDVAKMDSDMKANIISDMILGGWTGLGGVPATKERKLKKIPAYLNKYYMNSNAALMQHLYGMRKLIEARRFFGKIPKRVSEIRKGLYAAQAKIRELNKNLGGSLSKTQTKQLEKLEESTRTGRLDEKQTKYVNNRIKTLRNMQTGTMPEEQAEQIRKQRNKHIGLKKEYTAYINAYATERDYTENIGTYVMELIDKGEIDAKHERIVNEILNARFHEKGTHGIVQAYKNLSYIDTMGSPISALTQIGDLAWAAYEGGFIRAGKHAIRAVMGKERITKEDVGVTRIAQEFADSGTLGNAVSKVFKIVGLEKIDSIGKEALLNVALEKYQKQAKKNPIQLKNQIKSIFENETDSVIDDLINNETSDNVKLLVYHRLLDFQPVALSEMPQRYLDAGNGRLFYMLKTFTLKVFDAFRNESYNKIKNGNKAEKIQGMENLVRLAMMFVLANAGADELKDWVLGRKTDLGDRVTDNILRLFGVSKFVTWKARTEGVGSAIARQFLPPFKFIDSAGKDIITAGDEKGLEVIGSIPVLGKLAYWHLGRGTSKREDLWDRRLRKEKSKLNKVKSKLETSKNKPQFRQANRKALIRLNRANRLQGRLNEYKKRINRLKSLGENPTRKKAIQRLEQRRTGLIKAFLD